MSILPSAWQAEANGFGFAFRFVSFLPKFMPLLFMCQHGAEFNAQMYDLDIPNHYPTFVTWNPIRSIFAKDHYSKSVIVMCNPISAYFRAKYRNSKPGASGLIHFFAHSGPGFSKTEEHLHNVLIHLSSIKESVGHITLCFHPADFNDSNSALCKSFGVTPITNRAESQQLFVNNLISNTLKHYYVSGVINQSAVMYAIDFGLKWIGHFGDEHAEMDESGAYSDYVDDDYAKSLSELSHKLLLHQNGHALVCSIVRAHLGVDHYRGRFAYAMCIWSTYFRRGIGQLVVRALYNVLRRRHSSLEP